ncbi:DUF3293 domain-containing protein [Photobacterium aquae]|uniref:DUF3293 domain-containing protein n=1 Tax=Photobacterium aquae TaxID=1195763 RepID=UPI00147038F1|nr:DUF3293 domain-containing protein [Photobacterium aquae]
MCEKLSLWCSYCSSIFKITQHPVYPCFAILTAFNPRSTVISNKENRLRHSQLTKELRRSGFSFESVVTCSPDGRWAEQGVMVAMDKSEACRVAARWEQNAIYWVENGELFLVPVLLAGFEQQSLGDWRGFLYT